MMTKYEEYIFNNKDSFPNEKYKVDGISTFTLEEAKLLTISAINSNMNFEDFKTEIDNHINSNKLLIRIKEMSNQNSNNVLDMKQESENIISSVGNRVELVEKNDIIVKEEIRRFNLVNEGTGKEIAYVEELFKHEDYVKASCYMVTIKYLEEYESAKMKYPKLDPGYSMLQMYFNDVVKGVNWNNFDISIYEHIFVRKNLFDGLKINATAVEGKIDELKEIFALNEEKMKYNFIIEQGMKNTLQGYKEQLKELINTYHLKLVDTPNVIDDLDKLYVDVTSYLNEYKKMLSPVHNLILEHGISDSNVIDDMMDYFLYRVIKQLDKMNNTFGFSKNISTEETEDLIKRINTNLYQLTSDQEKAIRVGVDRLNDKNTTNLLIQGDVSCGKTIVVIALMILLVNKGYKVCMIAPRRSLRTQHINTIKEITSKLGFNYNVVDEVNDENYQTFDILVKGYSFSNSIYDYLTIDVCFMDEIQLFGVEQRNQIQQKYPHVDMVFTTATPHPRTKLISMLGDLDVVGIREMPPGRLPKITKTFEEYNSELDELVKKLTENKELVLVICPLLKSGGFTPYQSVKPATDFYQKRYPDACVRSLSGSDDDEYRDNVLEQCNNGEIDILVATKVIEVGVDLPRASLIIIHYPHNQRITWGMSQLHQLRGRVGRRDKQGYCYIEVPQKFDYSAKDNPINAVLNTEDVFELTERDFNWRGFESIIGVRQTATSKKNQQLKLLVYEKITAAIPELITMLDKEFLEELYNNYKNRKVANLN